MPLDDADETTVNIVNEISDDSANEEDVRQCKFLLLFCACATYLFCLHFAKKGDIE